MAEAKAKRKKYIFMSARIAVVAAGIIWAVVWLSAEQRWQNLVELFSRINLWVFGAALGIFVAGQVIVGFRWWLLLRTQSVFINLFAAVRLHFLGLFYNNVMPSSVGGDLIRAWYVTHHTEKKFEAALSVFVDRIIGLLSTLVIAMFFYLLFLKGRGAVITSSRERGGFFERLSDYRHIIFWALAVIALLFVAMLSLKAGRAILAKASSSIIIHSRKMFRKLKDAAFLYCSRPLVILTAFGLTIFLQIATITGFWLIGHDAERDHAPLLRELEGLGDRRPEAALAAHVVVGGHNEEHGILPVAGRLERRHCQSRGRVTPLGLKDDGRGSSGEHPELLGHQKSVGFVADHDRLHDADPESGVLRFQAI